ncbi:uncharacterized protein LOC132115787 [Carassius carassius]|uniref:uncharacterized protein LOC132115787 n=1 Tax=Carassius carassius TaxID=217509 RepID=UPI0028692BD3|nr:uncharacterized protein LOC132115787 [Carassius carassius]
MASSDRKLSKFDELIKKSKSVVNGNPTRYQVQKMMDNTDTFLSYQKIFLGERNKQKSHKTILLVGETGTGKTTLINTMINYMLGVQREDKVWFEFTDDQSDRSSAQSQTSSVTVYGFYLQESPIDLTIIDTPGYGDTRGVNLDKKIAKSLLNLSKSEEGIHEIHAVCLVIKASQNRLSDRQKYIFDAVQSLFGKDISENIVLLFTHSDGMRPKNALTAVEAAEIQCAVNKKNQPVYFLFNNCQSDAADGEDDEEYDEEYDEANKQRLDQSWNLSFRGITRLFKFLDTIKPKSLEMTRDVIEKRERLEANVSNIRERVKMMEKKQIELKQTQEALEKNKQDVIAKKNFEYEVEVPYKEIVDIDTSLASKALCCVFCEENCHYPGCWWVANLAWCEVMKNDYCTVCTNKCHYSKHVKQPKIYQIKTKKEKRFYEGLKKKYDDSMIKIGDDVSLVKKLNEELQELEKEKIMLVTEAFDCVESLDKIALKSDSAFTLLHIDALIMKLKEINEPDKARKLDIIKKRAGGEKHGALDYLKRFFFK